MSRMRGMGRAHRPLKQRGFDGGHTQRGPYRLRGIDSSPTVPLLTTNAVELPFLTLPLTFFPPRVGTFTTVVVPRLEVPLTFFSPKVVAAVKVPLLTVPLTLFPPVVFAVPPPTFPFFTPPIEPYLKVPPVPRTDWLLEMQMASGIPRSSKYRQFLATQVGKTVEIDGVVYGGGRWHGPLTPAQVAAITAAGYGARIVYVTGVAALPAGID